MFFLMTFHLDIVRRVSVLTNSVQGLMLCDPGGLWDAGVDGAPSCYLEHLCLVLLEPSCDAATPNFSKATILGRIPSA